MGCATATIKYLVFIFNALCALLGIGVIVVNSIALKNVHAEQRIIVIFLIVIGSIVFLISLFGCCGAIKENVCLTWMYAIILLVILILTCVLCFVFLNRFDEHKLSEDLLNDAWKKQKNGTDAMAIYQTTFHCCGINDPLDYANDNLTLPDSCFATNESSPNANAVVYPNGCLSIMTEFYERALAFVRLFGWILIAVEGSAFLFATILAINFNNDERRLRY